MLSCPEYQFQNVHIRHPEMYITQKCTHCPQKPLCQAVFRGCYFVHRIKSVVLSFRSILELIRCAPWVQMGANRCIHGCILDYVMHPCNSIMHPFWFMGAKWVHGRISWVHNAYGGVQNACIRGCMEEKKKKRKAQPLTCSP